MTAVPPWGTHPDDLETVDADRRPRAARVVRVVGLLGLAVVCVGVVVLDVRSPEANGLLDAGLAMVMLIVGCPVVVVIVVAVRRLIVGGHVGWARTATPALLVLSAWAVSLADAYGETHRRPGGTVTPLAELLLLAPVLVAIAALVGVGLSWVWTFTPSGRAAARGAVAGVPSARSGRPADDAGPPFSFRVPHREAWHQLVLPSVVLLTALLGVVSVLVHDISVVAVELVLVTLLLPWLVPVVLPAYWRRLDVGPEGLRIVRLGGDHHVRWADLLDAEVVVADPDSGSCRLEFVTRAGRLRADVPAGRSGELRRWRSAILAARPPGAEPDRETVTPDLPLLARLRRAARTRRRGVVLWLVILVAALPYEVMLLHAVVGRLGTP